MITDKLKSIILKELDLEEFPIVETTTAPMVPGWDSLRHIRVLCAIEESYGIRFKTLEVLRLRNVGDLQALVDSKIR
jgi:acyl carrier protein